MFSKTVIKKMATELSVQTMVSMSHEALDGITGDEVTEEVVESVSNIELLMAEIRRRAPQEKPQPRKRTEKPPAPILQMEEFSNV